MVVFSHLADDTPSLKAIALVHKPWLSLARTFLFQALCLHPGNYAKLLHTPKRAFITDSCSYVRELRLSAVESWIHEAKLPLPTFPSVTKLLVSNAIWESFINLHRHANPWVTLPKEVWINSILVNLRYLTLVLVLYPSLGKFYEVISHAPCLEHLVLCDVRYSSDSVFHSEELVKLTMPPSVRVEAIAKAAYLDALTALAFWSRLQNHPPILNDLTVYHPSTEDAACIAECIQIFGKTIQDVTLELRPSEMGKAHFKP